MYILKKHTQTLRELIKPTEPTASLWSCSQSTRGDVWASKEGFTRLTHRHKITPLLTINGRALFFTLLCLKESNIWGCYSCQVSKEAVVCQTLASKLSQCDISGTRLPGHWTQRGHFGSSLKQLRLLNHSLTSVHFQHGGNVTNLCYLWTEP